MNEPSPLLNRLLLFFYALFVLGSTFSIAIAQASLGVATVLFIVVAVKDRYNPFRELQTVYLWIGLYLAWLLLSGVMGRSPVKSIDNSREEWLFAAMVIGTLLCRRDLWRERLVTLLGIGVGFFSVYTFVEYITDTHWLNFVHGGFAPEPIVKVAGNFTHYLTFANYYATAGLFLFAYALFPSELSRRRRTYLLLAGGLAMAATVLTASRTPIAAILVGLVLCAAVRRGKYRGLSLALTGIILLLAVFQPATRGRFENAMSRDTSTTYEGSRIFIWQRSLDIIVSHPVFGVGQGNFRDEYVARLRPDVPEERKHAHAHNDFLNVAAVAGIPGAIFFAGMWVVILRRLGKVARTVDWEANRRRLAFAALVGSIVFLITSMTEATFADEEVRELLMFIWAVGLAAGYKGGKTVAAKVLDTQ